MVEWLISHDFSQFPTWCSLLWPWQAPQAQLVLDLAGMDGAETQPALASFWQINQFQGVWSFHGSSPLRHQAKPGLVAEFQIHKPSLKWAESWIWHPRIRWEQGSVSLKLDWDIQQDRWHCIQEAFVVLGVLHHQVFMAEARQTIQQFAQDRFQDLSHGWVGATGCLPSGYVKIAIENGHL